MLNYRYLALVAICAFHGILATETTVTKTVTRFSVSTSVSTYTSTTTIAVASPLPVERGINVGFGVDPLVVSGTGAFAGYSTPADNPKGATTGNGYLQTNFNKSHNNFETVTVGLYNVSVKTDTTYATNIYCRRNGRNKFCFLYFYAYDFNGELIGQNRCNCDTGYYPCDGIFSTGSNHVIASIEYQAQCGPNGPGFSYVDYSVFFDDFSLSIDKP